MQHNEGSNEYVATGVTLVHCRHTNISVMMMMMWLLRVHRNVSIKFRYNQSELMRICLIVIAALGVIECYFTFIEVEQRTIYYREGFEPMTSGLLRWCSTN